MKIIIFIISLTLFPNYLFACSSIWLAINGYYLLGANLDSESNWDGLIFINQRNVKKSTDIYNEGDTEVFWRSKYGSVTFNLVCKEYAQYGMNEQGLIVSTVSNPKTKGPRKDKRPSMFGNLWVQYLLDVCKTTEEVKSTLKEIRVVPGIDRYVVCDKFMNSIIIEFQDHEIIIFENESQPINVLTNQSYTKCLTNFNNDKLPSKENIFDYITTKRFFDATNSLKGSNIVDQEKGILWLFENLKKVEGSPKSIWRIVFDQLEMKAYFLTKSNEKKRFIDLNKIDFSCSGEATMLNIDNNIKGDILKLFEPYSSQENFRLYKSAMNNIGKSITVDEIWEHIKFLEKFRCD
jgi:Linear amide C-N hydrolases, choloylglycine hydrolase family